jgi:hypothetical protein
LAAVLAAAGCSKSEPAGQGGGGAGGTGGAGGAVASCLSTRMATCTEYRGANLAAGADGLASLCTAVDAQAAFTKAACPTDKVIARCTKPIGTEVYYEGFVMPLDQLERACTGAGNKFSLGQK